MSQDDDAFYSLLNMWNYAKTVSVRSQNAVPFCLTDNLYNDVKDLVVGPLRIPHKLHRVLEVNHA